MDSQIDAINKQINYMYIHPEYPGNISNVYISSHHCYSTYLHNLLSYNLNEAEFLF